MIELIEPGIAGMKNGESRSDAPSHRSRELIFRHASAQGFGDRHNSWAWSMFWWQGRLYVGTNRAFLCAERAAIARGLPLLSKFSFAKYPPDDPDAGCVAEDTKLPLQAEIWRWAPENDQWERVFQSPQEVPLPKDPGKYTARDIGFRDIAAFMEPDGAEALYVSGVGTHFIFEHGVAPSLLRSTDGATFESVPMDKGEFLGDEMVGTYRTLTSFQDRLFMIAGGIRGDGCVIESRTPAAGSDAFQKITPDGMFVFEMLPYRGALYIGTRDSVHGYSVLKTDASGSPPYRFIPVVTNGGFAPEPSRSVISMKVFQDRLYVGMDKPGEIIRINPDDSWDLIAGTPRRTPSGWKYPLSGLESGFYDWLNVHVWRMEVHKDRLYIGTAKMSTHFRNVPGSAPILQPNYGFDLFETEDGCHFTPITRNGWGDMFAFGIRSFADTPHGLFFGTANSWYGLQIWHGSELGKQENSPAVAPALDVAVSNQTDRTDPTCDPVERLEVEHCDDRVTLSWEPREDARRFHIWRADIEDIRPFIEKNRALHWPLRILRLARALRRDLYLPPLAKRLWVPGAFIEIDATEEFFWQDQTATRDKRYLYYVCAESADGGLSLPSNIAAAPALHPPITFVNLGNTLDRLIAQMQIETASAPLIETTLAVRALVSDAQTHLQTGDAASAIKQLQDAYVRIDKAWHAQNDAGIVWQWQDLRVSLQELIRRIALVQAGCAIAASL